MALHVVFALIFVQEFLQETVMAQETNDPATLPGECTKCNDAMRPFVCNENGKVNLFKDLVEDNLNTTRPKLYIPLLTRLTGAGSRFSLPYATEVGMFCALEYLNTNNVTNTETGNSYEFFPLFADHKDTRTGAVASMMCLNRAGVNYAVGFSSDGQSTAGGFIGTLFSMNLVSPSAPSLDFSNKDETFGYPYFSRVIGSNICQAYIFNGFAKKMQWNTFSLIYIINFDFEIAYWEGELNAFLSVMNAENTLHMNVYNLYKPSENAVRNTLQQILETQSRVVYVIASDGGVIAKEARELGMFKKGWAWFGRLTYIGDRSGATPYDDGALQISNPVGAPPNQTSDEAKYYDTCVDSMNNSTNPFFEGITHSLPADVLARYTYDATLVLGRAAAEYGNNEYDADDFAHTIRKQRFQGASGEILLDPVTGDRLTCRRNIRNVVNSKITHIGTVHATLGVGVDIELFDGHELQFFGGTTDIPKDVFVDCERDGGFTTNISTCIDNARQVTFELQNPELATECSVPDSFTQPCRDLSFDGWVMFSLVVTFVLLCILGAVIHSRNAVEFQLAQSKVVMCMIFGAILTTLSYVVYLAPLSVDSCFASTLLNFVGVVGLIGGLLVKSHKVYKVIIVSGRKLSVVHMEEKVLLLHLTFLVAVAAGIVIIERFVDPIKVIALNRNVNGYQIPFYTCDAENGAFATARYFYLAIMLVACSFFAYNIQHLPTKIAESKWLYVAIYNGCAFIVARAAIQLSGLDRDPALRLEVVIGALTSLITICLIVVPKFWELKYNSTSHLRDNSTSNFPSRDQSYTWRGTQRRQEAPPSIFGDSRSKMSESVSAQQSLSHQQEGDRLESITIA